MKRLDTVETASLLQANGLSDPCGAGFAFRDAERQIAYDWHVHAYHQLTYAIDGTAWIETVRSRHNLSMGRAVWIPAGVRHRTLLAGLDGLSLYFAPTLDGNTGADVRTLAAVPFLRDMILYASRWPRAAVAQEPLQESYFRVLALLCNEAVDDVGIVPLPEARHPGLVRAMDEAIADPRSASFVRAVKTAALSERTFRRRFLMESGVTWQAWLAHARVNAAADALSKGERVSDVAARVGYESMSAFAKVFAKRIGESPAFYRSRILRDRLGHPRR